MFLDRSPCPDRTEDLTTEHWDAGIITSNRLGYLVSALCLPSTHPTSPRTRNHGLASSASIPDDPDHATTIQRRRSRLPVHLSLLRHCLLRTHQGAPVFPLCLCQRRPIPVTRTSCGIKSHGHWLGPSTA